MFSRRIAALVGAAIALIGAMAALFFSSRSRVVALRAHNPNATSYMLARDTDVEEIAQRTRMNWLTLDRISPLLICAVVKAEDRTFFRHRGWSIGATERALGWWISNTTAGGGSTITQQLARNLFLSDERTLLRKTRELVLAWQLERQLTKARILELYLNTAEWGRDAWGIRMASARYFRARPDSLTAFESSFLAAVLPAPRAPPSGKNGVRILGLQHRILAQLAHSQVLSKDDAEAAAYAADEYATAVATGAQPLPALLKLAAETEPAGASLTLRAAVATECGLDREIQREQLLHR